MEKYVPDAETIEISTAASLLGLKGGASRSEAKVAAVRENGRKGGRPKMTIREAKDILEQMAKEDTLKGRVALSTLENGYLDTHAPWGMWTSALFGEVGLKGVCGLVAVANRLSKV